MDRRSRRAGDVEQVTATERLVAVRERHSAGRGAVERPKTRRLEESMDDVSNDWSKVIEMAVPGEANVCRTGLVATTLGCAEIAVSGANAVSVVTRSDTRTPCLGMSVSPSGAG